MEDEGKTKKQLISEVIELRQWVAALNATETERRQARAALRESEARFRNLLDYIPGVSIQGYTADGIVRYWNKASEEVYGYPAEEAIGRNLGDLIIPPEVKPQFKQALELGAKCTKCGEFMPPGELMLLHKNGSLVPVYSIHTVVSLSGRPPLMFCIDVDLSERKRTEEALRKAHNELERRVEERTAELAKVNDKLRREIEERKRAEEALRESREWFRAIFETAEDSIFIKDRHLRYTLVNPTMERLFGVPASQLLEKSDEELFGDEAGAHIREVDSCVLRGEIIDEEHTKPLAGVPTTFHVIKVPIRDNSGEIIGLCGIARDITERKQAEEALRKSYTEIEQLKDRLQAESEYLRAEIKLAHSHGEIVGESEAIKRVFLQLEQVAPTESSVLITGETGTGKELIARAIHNLSKRKDRVMVKVDCASLPSALVESELFGRQKGAYTGALTSQVGRFEVADGSSIFLDEIGELSPELQVKLLRVIQEGEFERLGSPKTIQVNVRVIAATNRDLSAEVRKGNFREDLYYRLNVFHIEVPPLRERLDDIPLLVWTFVNEFAEKMGKKIQTVPKRTMEALQRYHWPGNVRELRNVIEHAVIVSTSDMLKVKLPQDPRGVTSRILTLKDAERQHITKVLERTNWRIKGPHGAAELLGLKPSTLYTKMNKLAIPTSRNKDAIPT